MVEMMNIRVVNNSNEHSISDTIRNRDIFGNPLSQEEIDKLSVQRIPSAPLSSFELESQISEGIMINDENEAFPVATAVAYPAEG
jgi:hypothetical protein